MLLPPMRIARRSVASPSAYTISSAPTLRKRSHSISLRARTTTYFAPRRLSSMVVTMDASKSSPSVTQTTS